MKLHRPLILTILLFALTIPLTVGAVVRTSLGRPDLDSIKDLSTNPDSEFFYDTLYKKFMQNDTLMSDQEFQYFYYGTLFQEDYDPYRGTFRPKQLEVLMPIYLKEKQSRAERQMVLDYALASLEDNPVNIRQLVHRVFTYEKNGKYDLAKIWQYKLNHILLVIAASGTGTDPETARIVVYPEHEYDFLNLAGYTATGQKFEPPYFDYISVAPKNSNDVEGFYFDVSEMLRQYYMKHPSELGASAFENEVSSDEEPVSDDGESETL